MRQLKWQASSEAHASADTPEGVEADAMNKTPPAMLLRSMRISERPAAGEEEHKWFMREIEQSDNMTPRESGWTMSASGLSKSKVLRKMKQN